MFHSISVRTARSCAGALRAVTSAVLIHGRLFFVAQTMQRLEQRLERSGRQRLQGLVVSCREKASSPSRW
jgi:hypothetical protein